MEKKELALADIASVSGKGGLYKVLNPTRNGVILESMDGSNKKIIADISSKVSVLSDISIYTTDSEGTVALQAVFHKIWEEFQEDTGLSSSSSNDELKAFMKFILPEYDESRVYVSDIKKLVSWYNMLSNHYPQLVQPEAKEEKIEKKPKATKKGEEEK